jgi:hypothetical protein
MSSPSAADGAEQRGHSMTTNQAIEQLLGKMAARRLRAVAKDFVAREHESGKNRGKRKKA